MIRSLRRLRNRQIGADAPTIRRTVWFARSEVSQVLNRLQEEHLRPDGSVELCFEGNVDLGIHAALDDGTLPIKQEFRFPVCFITRFSAPPDINVSFPGCAGNVRAEDVTGAGFTLVVATPRPATTARKARVVWSALGVPVEMEPLVLRSRQLALG